MRPINLANNKGRDAVVASSSVSPTTRVRWIDSRGRQAQSQRSVRSVLSRDYGALIAKYGDADAVAAALIREDPEVDVELYGAFLRETSRVYIDPDGHVVHSVREFEVRRSPDGTERDRRLYVSPPPNTNTEFPLKWSGKMMPRGEVVRKFVLAAKQQITHVNGLTYDFLFAMAKELEEKDSMLIVGAGPKSAQPLVFHRGGTAYRGFLEGRTKGDEYALVLHLSNLELKKMPPESEGAPPAGTNDEPVKESS